LKLCALVLCALLASAQTVYIEEFEAHLVRFDTAYQTFVREFCGWKDNWPTTACDPRAGVIDSREFGRAREAAAVLFQLKEK